METPEELLMHVGEYGTQALKFIHRTRNWGDFLAPYLYRKIAGRRATRIPMLRPSRHVHYLTVGSVLRMADSHSLVWGTGFIGHDDGLGLMRWGPSNNERLHVPRRVFAVRGKLTRSKLLRLGVDCPEVYGDPALLMPLFYPGKRRAKYPLGIIPHYTDLNTPLMRRLAADPRVRIISMLKSRWEQVVETAATYERVVDELLACSAVVSGSLHGIILADAYGVPCRWIELEGRAIGDNFKYLDHFSCVGRTLTAPLALAPDATVDDILASIPEERLSFNPRALLDACPFLPRGRSIPSSV